MNAINRQLSEIYGSFSRRVRTARDSFDSDEAGLSTVEMLLLLFIGVVIIIAIIAYFWGTIWPAITGLIDNLFGMTSAP